jgi:plasmid maintenance system antidote protein VapI
VLKLAFGKNLQNYMDTHGLSISDVVRLSGVPYTTIHSIIKRDSANIAIDVAVKISKALGVSIDDIQGWTGNQKIPADQNEALSMLEKERRELLDDINQLSPADQEQIKALIRHLALRAQDQAGKKQ